MKILRQPVQTQTTVTEPKPSVLRQERVRLRLQRRVTIIIRAATIRPAIIPLVLLREIIATIRRTTEQATHREAVIIRPEAAVIPVAAQVAAVAVIPAEAAEAAVTAAAVVAEEGKIHA